MRARIWIFILACGILHIERAEALPKKLPSPLKPATITLRTDKSTDVNTASATSKEESVNCVKGDSTQIFSGDVTISTTADLAQLSGKCVIEGDLIIKSDLANLDGLISLRHVTGNLNISENSNLESMAALNNLKTIDGYLWIADNPKLKQIRGLHQLIKTSGLIIERNALLASISGFKSLRIVSTSLVAITDNDNLKSITGFESLRIIEKDFNLYGNEILSDFAGMNALQSVGGNFKIWENPSLTTITGFNKLNTTGSSQFDDFKIYKNTALQSMPGFTSMTAVKNLTLQYNSSLPKNLAECLASQVTIEYYKLLSYNGAETAETCPAATPITSTSTTSSTRIKTGTITGTRTDTGTRTATDTGTAGATGTGTGTGTGSGTGTGTSTSGDKSAASTRLTVDFSAGLPEGVSGDCTASDGAIHLPKNSDGTHIEECHFDISFEASEISGQTIVLDATRVNSLVKGDFEGMGATDVRLYAPTNTAYKTDKDTGAWYSSVTNYTRRPVAAEDSDGNATMTLTKYVTGLTQFVKVKPGANFRLSLDADTSLLGTAAGTDQLFYLSMAFYDDGFKALNFLSPINRKTASSQGNFINYGPDEGLFHEEMLLLVMDCEDHITYPGDGVYGSTLSINQCLDSSGNAQTNESGEVYTADDIDYMSIVLSVNWSTADGSTAIDNVVLDYMQQIEMQILNLTGDVKNKASGGNSMYAGTVTEDGTLRIYLRTLKPTESPRINSIKIPGSAAVTVTAGAQKTSYTQSRLGGLRVFGPKSDYVNTDITMRSLCTDPLTGESISCLDLGSRYDNKIFRWAFFQNHFSVKKTADGTDWEFSLSEDGELYLKRMLEFTDLEQQVNATLVKSGGFMYEDPDDGKSYEVRTEVNKLPDTLGERSELEQNYYLMEKYAATIGSLFKGTTSYTFKYVDAGKTVTLPKITYYEIFNEDNITETSWASWDAWGGIEDDTSAATVAESIADLQALVSNAILAYIPDAKISYSSLAAHYGPVFNTDDLTLLGTYLDKKSFTLNNFHPYANTDPIHGKEDLIKKRWAATESVLSALGMGSYDTFFGEYGYTKEIYDPACEYDSSKRVNVRASTPNLEWSRGYGDIEFANLVARQTATLLSLPGYGINPYGVQTQENEAWGYSINDDGTGGLECWQSSTLVRFELFDRVKDTGILANKDDEPTQYKLNRGGVALAILSKYLARANPLVTTQSHSLGQDEFLNTELFALGDGRYAMTASYYRTYDYGTDYMDYISGAKDNGFTDKKQFDFTIEGISVTSGEVVSLVDGSKTTLAVSNNVVEDVVVGALPVIVIFNGD